MSVRIIFLFFFCFVFVLMLNENVSCKVRQTVVPRILSLSLIFDNEKKRREKTNRRRIAIVYDTLIYTHFKRFKWSCMQQALNYYAGHTMK